VRRLLETVVLALTGALPAAVIAAWLLRSAPPWSLRTNVSGRTVPAVLGLAVVAGGVVSLALTAAGAAAAWVLSPGRTGVAAAVVLALLGGAGVWDDRGGDEAPRGFRGHLSAGRLTGGLVKIAAGGAAGALAGWLLYSHRIGMGILTALAVPLAANLFNLLDRAPGRSGKAALGLGIPLLALGADLWAIAAAGTLGALAVTLPLDLGERGMLGDAGANPVGGLLGLGLALSLEPGPLAAAVATLLALNLASEKWSFSEVIARTPPLRAFDGLGRK
jgi:UDP-GlcNAc:undecaprenyl-phosphate GlcNAc-1-phosphate transferase